MTDDRYGILKCMYIKMFYLLVKYLQHKQFIVMYE